jgi:Pyruvate:ferredoxin oxidoreductase and related 2-oxoacid:ferredoxin oxidoreductases, beta subunit
MAFEKRRPVLVEHTHTFCPGCGHGIFARLLAEAIQEAGYERKAILSLGVGCCCNMNPPSWSGDVLQTAHGRAASVATGVKVARPDLLSISYQGDGDAYVIGLNETLNAAYRGENICTFVILNNNFAMTGGQMSWTTMPGQKTTTSPAGRDCKVTGMPIKVPEIMATLPNVSYVARGAVTSPKNINQLKKYIKEAISAQINGEGYSFVEIVSPCPTNWAMNVKDSIKWIDDNVIPYYPLGVLKERTGE